MKTNTTKAVQEATPPNHTWHNRCCSSDDYSDAYRKVYRKTDGVAINKSIFNACKRLPDDAGGIRYNRYLGNEHTYKYRRG